MNRPKRLIVIILMSTLFSSCAIKNNNINNKLTYSDAHYTAPIGTEFIQLHSIATNRDYEISVVLPASYDKSTEQFYPVLYMTDAQWDLSLVESIRGKSNYDRVMPEFIIVGISYPGENVNYGALRGRDLSPTNDGIDVTGSGDAPKFLNFIEQSIIPRVESDYRINPNQRVLGGASFGGLFSLYAMYEKPELFQSYISLSPGVSWDSGYIFRKDNSYAAQNIPLQCRLFISYGSSEYTEFMKNIVLFQKKIAERKYNGLKLLNYTIEGERHGSANVEGWARGLRWAFKDLIINQPSGLESYFKDRSFDFKIVE